MESRLPLRKSRQWSRQLAWMWKVTGQAYLLSSLRRETLRISSQMLALVVVVLSPFLLLLVEPPLVVQPLHLLLRKRRKSPRKRVMMIWDSAYSIRSSFQQIIIVVQFLKFNAVRLLLVCFLDKFSVFC